ncbi:MAG: FecR domain-containing protein [Betaproteobacteria bacterium]|nr:FecR domain-containing protein [Betaproteobacteria bacterium]
MAAAQVSNLTGTAQAIPGAGAPRALKQGDRVNQGETVSTGAGSSIVMTFDDGQIVALTANARLAINTYNYNKEKPAESNVLLNLASGGMRAITGLIGKAKPSNVAYRAGNATIGIRGTDLEIGAGGDDLYVIANEGAAEVEMAPARTGSLPLSGQMFGMSLPVSASAEPIQLAQATTRFSVTVNQGFVRVQGINRNLTPAQIRAAVVQANNLAPAAQQLSAPQLQQILNSIVNTVRASQASGAGAPPPPPPPAIDFQRPTSGQTGTGAGSGSGSGGGSTLPLCSSISPVSARLPGTNCRNET